MLVRLSYWLFLQSELVKLLAKFPHRKYVLSPEGVLLRPVNQIGDLLLGPLIATHHQIGFVCPRQNRCRGDLCV
jgi:hypothetical protein